ncbi:hypothetical protein [Kitasatospora sp. NPDC088134]|uniref:hypothetical protein n=1 Tax=Kitasatospora sp. NPDC088134 TaxID=3364071 RepID=UPI00382F702A
MTEHAHGIGDGPIVKVGLSLPEGTAAAVRARVGKRGFSAFIAAAVERELRGRILDEYLADYERRNGPVSAAEQDRARQVLAGESDRPTRAEPRAHSDARFRGPAAR